MRRASLESRSRPRPAIAQILVRDGKAVGVATTTGDEYYAAVISSSVDPNLTFLKMHRAAST